MSMVRVPAFKWPQTPRNNPQFDALSTLMIMNDSNDKVAFIFRAPKTGTIDTVEFQTNGYTGTNTVKAALQNLDSGGLPDGTDLVFRSVTPTGGTNQWAVPSSLTNDGTGGGSKLAVTRGQELAFVVSFSAYTSGTLTIMYWSETGNAGWPYTTAFETGWTNFVEGWMFIAIKYDDGHYYPLHEKPCLPIKSFAANVEIGHDTTPDERGIRFRPPVDMIVSGLWWRGMIDYLGVSFIAEFSLMLYDGSDNILAEIPVAPKNIAMFDEHDDFSFLIPGPDVKLSAGQLYRMTVRGTNLPNNNRVLIFTVNCHSAQILAEAGPYDAHIYATARTDLGAWSETPSGIYLCGLVVTGLGQSRSTPRTRPVRIGG